MPKIPRRKKRRTNEHPLYPEPGAHILDSYNGLPKLSPPPPLSNKGKLTASEIHDYISYEGLGYCIHNYISSGKIADPHLRELWSEAREAMINIVEFLEDLPEPVEKRKKKKKYRPKRTTRAEIINDTEEL